MTFQDFLMNSPSGGLMIKVGDGTPIGGLPPWIASDTVNGGLMFKVNAAGYTPPDGMLQTGTALNATLQVVNDNVGTNSALSLSTLGISVNGSTDLGANTASTNIVTLKSTTRNQIQVPSGSTLEFWYSAAAEGARLNSSGFQIGTGTITQNGQLTIKGSGSNILSLRNSSNVEKAYFSDDGTLNSGGGWADTVGYTSYLKNATLGLYDGNTITGITGSNGFVFSTKIMLGGTTASYPAIKRNGAAIDFRLADDSGYAAIVTSMYSIGQSNPNLKGIVESGSQIQVNYVNSGGVRFSNSSSGFKTLIVGEYSENMISMGGITSSFPAIKRNGAAIDFRLADDSGYANINLATGTASGALQAGSFSLSGGGSYSISNSSKGGRIYSTDSSARAGFLFTDIDLTGAIFLQLGGTTSSFPAIKRNGAAIDFRLADDSGYAALNANSLTLSGNLFLSSGNAIYAGTQLRIGAGAISILSDSAAGINFTAGASGRSFGISSATSGAPNSTAFLFVGDTATGVTMGANSINNASAILDLVSTTKGFLMPRQTTAQINAISTPAAGLQVYNTDLAQPCFYDGTGWRKVSHTTM